jgi:hypothetical protein
MTTTGGRNAPDAGWRYCVPRHGGAVILGASILYDPERIYHHQYRRLLSRYHCFEGDGVAGALGAVRAF